MTSGTLLLGLLRRLVMRGRLTVILSDGTVHPLGLPAPDRPDLTLRTHTRAAEWRLVWNPYLALGETYMDGTLTVEGGNIADLLALLLANVGIRTRDPLLRATAGVQYLGRWLAQFNPVSRAKANVAHHYDLSDGLFDIVLDADRQYSCAYFETPTQSLDAAQAAKKRHVAAKLCLTPGLRVLDIGSGWGGLGLHLCRQHGVDVTGITLSKEQFAKATARAETEGLMDRLRFRLEDYRHTTGSYDRIVSVGMFEHVGINHYARFFRTVHDRLNEDGIALIHTIGRSDGPGATNPWIRKYIFPGGYTPALSEMMPPIERSGLILTDVEVLRLHYAETLRHWRQRFIAHWDAMARLYDERFCRMWEFYLASSEMSFRHSGLVVYQLQLAKRIDTVPMTRAYLYTSDLHQGSSQAARAR